MSDVRQVLIEDLTLGSVTRMLENCAAGVTFLLYPEEKATATAVLVPAKRWAELIGLERDLEHRVSKLETHTHNYVATRNTMFDQTHQTSIPRNDENGSEARHG
jgi:hypothetical protein